MRIIIVVRAFFFYDVLGDIRAQGWFLDSSYVWTERIISSQTGNHSFTLRYTFDSSPTLINGNTYYEKLVSHTPSGNDWSSTNFFYRTDDSGRVYVSYFANENLVYDYNLEVNDSFYLPNGSDLYLVVDKIDSIQLENGEKRKHLALRCSFDEDPLHGWGYSNWIEGLGGERGVYDIYFDECYFDGIVPITLCISRNDTLLYDNPNYDSCWFVTTATVNIKADIISIFPNPAFDQIQVTGIENQSEKFIYNLTGEILYDGMDNPIDVHAFPSGMYILEVRRKGDYTTYSKFLKL